MTRHFLCDFMFKHRAGLERVALRDLIFNNG
jgi:hypothetical protein